MCVCEYVNVCECICVHDCVCATMSLLMEAFSPVFTEVFSIFLCFGSTFCYSIEAASFWSFCYLSFIGYILLRSHLLQIFFIYSLCYHVLEIWGLSLNIFSE